MAFYCARVCVHVHVYTGIALSKAKKKSVAG